jgi:AAA family ATP:ADP antiporter
MTAEHHHSPLRAILDVHKSELPLALLMFSYFFLVITSFWILKPLKKGLFIQFYDTAGFDLIAWNMTAAQAELLAKILNMVVAYVAVVAFSWLVNRFRRQQLTYVFTAFFLACYVAYSSIVAAPEGLAVWSFYLFGDLYSTLMVATFFAFLNDSVTPDKAKRMYGLIGLGGVSGGFFGSMFVATMIASITVSGWLWICFGIGIIIAVTAFFAGRLVAQDPPPEEPAASSAMEEHEGNPAVAGAHLVFRSPYLLAIVAIVGLYEIVSTIMDFQFTSTIAEYLDGPAIGQQFSTVFLITNCVAVAVQLFLTSTVMTRLGVGAALLFLPVAAFAGSAAFMAYPILWVGSLLNTADNGFAYSINQSAKETLYVPTTKDEKYKAKAFIDMFVQRFAKAVAVVLSLGITAYFTAFSNLRWLSVFTILIVVIWIYAARYAGKRFREMTEPVESQPARYAGAPIAQQGSSVS